MHTTWSIGRIEIETTHSGWESPDYLLPERHALTKMGLSTDLIVVKPSKIAPYIDPAHAGPNGISGITVYPTEQTMKWILTSASVLDSFRRACRSVSSVFDSLPVQPIIRLPHEQAEIERVSAPDSPSF